MEYKIFYFIFDLERSNILSFTWFFTIDLCYISQNHCERIELRLLCQALRSGNVIIKVAHVILMSSLLLNIMIITDYKITWYFPPQDPFLIQSHNNRTLFFFFKANQKQFCRIGWSDHGHVFLLPNTYSWLRKMHESKPKFSNVHNVYKSCIYFNGIWRKK